MFARKFAVAPVARRAGRVINGWDGAGGRASRTKLAKSYPPTSATSTFRAGFPPRAVAPRPHTLKRKQESTRYAQLACQAGEWWEFGVGEHRIHGGPPKGTPEGAPASRRRRRGWWTALEKSAAANEKGKGKERETVHSVRLVPVYAERMVRTQPYTQHGTRIRLPRNVRGSEHQPRMQRKQRRETGRRIPGSASLSAAALCYRQRKTFAYDLYSMLPLPSLSGLCTERGVPDEVRWCQIYTIAQRAT
ncbi:hypothetical protein C8R44DRAFT_754622 [Mycena epipterygia]|nr:hypothetical protein C8R44DRAFT_754622 [Mycena epipterygia]